MAATVEKIPSVFAGKVVPHIVCKNCAQAIDFYCKAFGATERGRHAGPGESIMHAEIMIGDAPVMLNDEFPDWGKLSPQTVGGTSCSHTIYVEDTDAFVARAQKAGATVTMPPADMFWGDRYATITDPFGHQWGICTHIEDVTHEQMAERMDAWNEKNS